MKVSRRELEGIIRDAFRSGFETSGEGFNGEYLVGDAAKAGLLRAEDACVDRLVRSAPSSSPRSVHEALVEIFRAGRDAAIAADPGPGADGGTANLDQAAISIPRKHLRTIERAAEEALVSVRRVPGEGRSRYWVNTPTHGQGGRRTAMVEAAVEAMRQAIQRLGHSEWYAHVYYQVD